MKEYSLLRDIIARRSPSLLPLVDRLQREPLPEAERETLREALADELVERGLQEDGEPNRYGLQIDELIGRLGGRR